MKILNCMKIDLILKSSLGIALVLVGSGCSLAVPETRRLTISLPDSVETMSRSFDRSMNRTASLPASLGEFKCFGINISGPGIASNAQMNSCSENSSAPVGMIVGLASVGNNSLTVDVPVGPSRLIQLFAMTSTVGCPSFATFENGPDSLRSSFGIPYELARTTVDLTKNVEVEMRASYNSARPLRAFCPRQSEAPDSPAGEGVPAPPGIRLSFADWPRLTGAEVNEGTVRVVDGENQLIDSLDTNWVYFSYSYDSQCNDTVFKGGDSGLHSAVIQDGAANYSALPIDVTGQFYLRAQAEGAQPACSGPMIAASGGPFRLELLGPNVIYASPSPAPLMSLKLFDRAGAPVSWDGSSLMEIFGSAPTLNYSLSSSLALGSYPIYLRNGAGSLLHPSPSPIPYPSNAVILDDRNTAQHRVDLNFSLQPTGYYPMTSYSTIRVVNQATSPVSIRIQGPGDSAGVLIRDGSVGVCSGPFTVSLEGINHNPATLVAADSFRLSLQDSGLTPEGALQFYSDAPCSTSLADTMEGTRLDLTRPSFTFYVETTSPGVSMIKVKDPYNWLKEDSYLMAFAPTAPSPPTQIIVHTEPDYDSIDGGVCRPVWIALTDESYLPAPLSSALAVSLSANSMADTNIGAYSPRFYGNSTCSGSSISSWSLPAGKSVSQVWVKKMGPGSWRLRVFPLFGSALRTGVADFYF